MRYYEQTVRAPSAEVEKAIGQAIELGQVESVAGARNRLVLPVRAGIRAGEMELEWALARSGDDTRVRLQVVRERLHTSFAALSILLVGAAGGVMTVVWPLHPDLLGLAPLGALLALLAWLLVVSRLGSYGPEEFLETLAMLAGDEEDE